MKTLALACLSALITLVALTTGACGPSKSCNDICTQENGCSAAVMRDCAGLCTSISTINSGGSCNSKYDDYRACVSNENICSPDIVTCSDQKTAWTTCAATYCAMHATDIACSSGTPVL